MDKITLQSELTSQQATTMEQKPRHEYQEKNFSETRPCEKQLISDTEYEGVENTTTQKLKVPSNSKEAKSGLG